MKNHRMIAIILLLCMLASLTACMPSNVNQTEPENTATTIPTTTATPPTTTAPKSTDCRVFLYETGIDNSVITEDTFVELFRHADYIMQNYETVSYPRERPFKEALRYCWVKSDYLNKATGEIEETSTDCILHIGKVSDEGREAALVLIMIALLLKEYGDNCVYGRYQYFDYEGDKNFEMPPYFIVTTDYKGDIDENIRDYGIRDYLDSINMDPDKIGDETFFVATSWYPETACILDYKEYVATLEQYKGRPNLYERIFAKAFPEE